MEQNRRNPIIFLPGLMGSIGGEMLGRKGNWGFGAARWIYDPFIKRLEDLGYRLEDNLFICYYDWRKECHDITTQFLKPMIERIKQNREIRKVDLLGHSMGGVVARTYVQTSNYDNDVGNLILLATPNKGALEAYYLWSTGKVKEDDKNERSLYDILRKGYIWLLSKILDIPLGHEHIHKLHEHFPGLGDLIPTEDYGPILCYEQDGNYENVPSIYIKYHNYFLNELNRKSYYLKELVEQVHCFIGTDYRTDHMLILDREAFLYRFEELITGSIQTMQGDGTVLCESGILEGYPVYEIKGSHGSILVESTGELANIYGIDREWIRKDNETFVGEILSILFKKGSRIVIETDENKILEFRDEKIYTNYEFIYEEFDKGYIWIMLKNLPKGQYFIEALPEKETVSDILLLGKRVSKEWEVSPMEKEEEKFPWTFHL